MMIELLLVAIIVIYIFIVNGKIDKNGVFGTNSRICNLLKEKDYDFLLVAKYGDRVYDPNEVFMKRVKKGVLTSAAIIFILITNVSYLSIIIALIIGFLVFKSEYFSLKKWYKQHLTYVD